MGNEGNKAIRIAESILKEAKAGSEKTYPVELPFHTGEKLMRRLRQDNSFKKLGKSQNDEEDLLFVLFRKVRRSLRIDPYTGVKFKRWKPGTSRPDNIVIDLNKREVDFFNFFLIDYMQFLRGKPIGGIEFNEKFDEIYGSLMGEDNQTVEERKKRMKEYRLDEITHTMSTFIELNEAFAKAGGTMRKEYLEFKIGK